MKNTLTASILFLSLSCCVAQTDRTVGGACDRCDEMFVGYPKEFSWQTTLSQKNEPGEPLEIEGTIFKADGKTPAEGVVLYVYHTDAAGLYSKNDRPGGNTVHGHLRGWIKTASNGKYKFTTIRPASYPNSKNPQHIHPLIKEPGLTLYWIDEYLFDDDPLLTKEERSRQEKRGGAGIIRLTKSDGVWKGRRDIVLGKNVPGY